MGICKSLMIICERYFLEPNDNRVSIIREPIDTARWVSWQAQCQCDSGCSVSLLSGVMCKFPLTSGPEIMTPQAFVYLSGSGSHLLQWA